MSQPDQHVCPKPDVLSSFLSGEMIDGAFEAIAEHVSTCDACSLQTEVLDHPSTGLPETSIANPVARSHSSVRSESDRVESSGLDAQEVDVNAVPEQIGEYQVLDLIGQGGMGLVYKARHCELNRDVAIKFLPKHLFDRPDARQRFDHEMKAAGLCDHPNIVRTHDARKLNNFHFFVMEYVKGRSLSEILNDEGPLAIADACAIASEVATALQYIHERGLVHRDIKPSNVMLTDTGEVKVLDLDLTRTQCENTENEPADIESLAKTESVGNAITMTATVLGTTSYMSPEQWSAASETDIRADIYSLGCTLFQMLTGRPPFAGQAYSTNWRSFQAHRTMPPRRLSAFRSDVPHGLEAIVRRMLAKTTEERFAVPADVQQALQPYISETKIVTSRRDPQPGEVTLHLKTRYFACFMLCLKPRVRCHHCYFATSSARM